MGHHPLHVGVQTVYTRLIREVEIEVEEVRSEQVVELDKVLPRSVDEALLGHVDLGLETELYSESIENNFKRKLDMS